MRKLTQPNRSTEHMSSCLAPEQLGRLTMYMDLSAALAHELSNPLCAARFALLLLEQDLQLKGRESNYYIEIISAELQRISNILINLRTSTGYQTEMNLSLEQIVQEIQNLETILESDVVPHDHYFTERS